MQRNEVLDGAAHLAVENVAGAVEHTVGGGGGDDELAEVGGRRGRGWGRTWSRGGGGATAAEGECHRI